MCIKKQRLRETETDRQTEEKTETDRQTEEKTETETDRQTEEKTTVYFLKSPVPGNGKTSYDAVSNIHITHGKSKQPNTANQG